MCSCSGLAVPISDKIQTKSSISTMETEFIQRISTIMRTKFTVNRNNLTSKVDGLQTFKRKLVKNSLQTTDSNIASSTIYSSNMTATWVADDNTTTFAFNKTTSNMNVDANFTSSIRDRVHLTTEMNNISTASFSVRTGTSPLVDPLVTSVADDTFTTPVPDSNIQGTHTYSFSKHITIIVVAVITSLASVLLLVVVIYLKKRNRALKSELSDRNVYDVAFSTDLPHISRYDRLDPKTREEIEPDYIYVVRNNNETHHI